MKRSSEYLVSKIQQLTKYNKIFANGFRKEGVAMHCNFGIYFIPLNILYNNIFESEMRLIEMNEQNEE